MHTILFVDDNRNIREFCGRELAREGYRVLLAGDGDEALRVLSQHSPDLVIMDVVMPRKDGISAVGQMLALHRDVPVIFHTSHKDYVDHRGGGLAKACVEKSGDLAELKTTVRWVLKRREGRASPAHRSGEGQISGRPQQGAGREDI